MTELKASWETMGRQSIVRVCTEQANYAHFSMVRNPSYLADGANTMVFHPLYVEKPWRRQGIATELVSAAARLAIEAGVTELRGQVESQHTLRIFRRLFGEERLSFLDRDPVKRSLVALPLSSAQAIASLERAEAYEDDVDSREIGLVTSIDVDGVDTANLATATLTDRLHWYA